MEADSGWKRDYLIVGQGLAGSLLALNLAGRGKSVLVIDDGHKHAASKVAAGLINPITGRRHALSWRFPECWAFLQADYERWENLLGIRCFFRKPMLRFLKTVEEKAAFEQKWETGDFHGIELDYPVRRKIYAGFEPVESCYRLHQAGFVDQKTLIQATRVWLRESNSLVEDTWKSEDFSRDAGIVAWRNYCADTVVFTQGFQNSANPFFRDLPFRHAKGELLELSGPTIPDMPILNRGKWLLPVSPGRFRAGATYDLKNIDLLTSDKGKDEILNALAELVDWKWEVVGHQAGVRPALHDFKPVLGRHPWYREVAIFNGLGSKGSLMAPLLAKEFVDHLEGDASLHPEADIDRFRKYL